MQLLFLEVIPVSNGYVLKEEYALKTVQSVWTDQWAVSHKVQEVLSKALETPAPDVHPT